MEEQTVDVIALMRELEQKINVNGDLSNIAKITKEHFIAKLGHCPRCRLFEERPKRLKNRDRNRISIILDNPCVCVVWRGIEIRMEFKEETACGI